MSPFTSSACVHGILPLLPGMIDTQLFSVLLSSPLLSRLFSCLAVVACRELAVANDSLKAKEDEGDTYLSEIEVRER